MPKFKILHLPSATYLYQYKASELEYEQDPAILIESEHQLDWFTEYERNEWRMRESTTNLFNNIDLHKLRVSFWSDTSSLNVIEDRGFQFSVDQDMRILPEHLEIIWLSEDKDV